MEDRKQTAFLADTHIHSEYSHDSVCPVSAIYRAAQEKQVNVVCITDHCDLYTDENPEEILQQRWELFENLRRDVQDCTDVTMLVGVELGAAFLFPKLAQRIVDTIPFDVVIGSIHGILFRGERKSTSKFDFGAVDEAAMMEYLEGYMDAAIFIAEEQDVDVLGHLTYIWRYISGRYGKNLDWRVAEPQIRRILRALIRRNISLEINTSCVGSSYDEWLPCKEIIDLYIDMGGQLFTLGSDDHKAEHLCHGFDAVKAYLKEKGIHRLVYYKNRKPQWYSI